MAAALPYVDDFVAGHSLAALEQLVEVLGDVREVLKDIERWRRAGKRVAVRARGWRRRLGPARARRGHGGQRGR